MTSEKQSFTIVARVPEYLRYSPEAKRADSARRKAHRWVEDTFKKLMTEEMGSDLDITEERAGEGDLARYRVEASAKAELRELDRRIAACSECAPTEVIIRVFSASESNGVRGPMTAADALRETNDTRGQVLPEALMRIEK